MQRVDRELSLGFTEFPVNPAFLHMLSPPRNSCDQLFHLETNVEIVWQQTSIAWAVCFPIVDLPCDILKRISLLSILKLSKQEFSKISSRGLQWENKPPKLKRSMAHTYKLDLLLLFHALVQMSGPSICHALVKLLPRRFNETVKFKNRNTSELCFSLPSII